MIAVATKLSSVTTAAKDAAHGVNTQLGYMCFVKCLGTRLGDISSEPKAMLPDSAIPMEHGEDAWLGDNTRGNAAGNTLHTHLTIPGSVIQLVTQLVRTRGLLMLPVMQEET